MLRSFRARPAAVIVLCLAVSLAACTSGAPAPTAATQPPDLAPLVTVVVEGGATQQPAAAVTAAPVGDPAAAAAGSITLAFIQEFDTLNPMYAQALSSIYTQQIWNCRAWNFDDQNTPTPVLVSEMPSLENGGISSDGRVITLKLRDDITWSDGQPITSADFQFTYAMITDPANAALSAEPYNLVEKLETPDAQTVVVTFKEPYAAWISALWHYLLPAHVLQPVFDAQGNLQNAEWNRAPTVGCGPYSFAGWESGVSARFTATPDYWLGKPKVGEVVVRFFPSDNDKSAALQSGQADLSVFLTNAALYVPNLRAGGAQIIPVNSGYHEGIFFFLDPENGHPALQDARVRQAIAMSLDRNKMAQDLLGGLPAVVETYWDGTPYMDPAIQPWPYDPERANQLLDEAGWVDSNANGSRDKDGVELILSYGTTTNEVRQAVQNTALAQLAAVGIKLELYNYDSGTFFAGLDAGGPAATGQLDLFQYAPRTRDYPDPGTNDFLCSQVPSANEIGENWSWICDEQLDQLLQQQATQIDFAQRQATLQKISKLVHDNVYFLGLWTDPDIWAAAPRLKNVHLSGVTPFYNIYEWELAQ
ncbi:MAG: peptide ABC transporter substrate-binding protein [Chloroflexota bacterium]